MCTLLRRCACADFFTDFVGDDFFLFIAGITGLPNVGDAGQQHVSFLLVAAAHVALLQNLARLLLEACGFRVKLMG